MSDSTKRLGHGYTFPLSYPTLSHSTASAFEGDAALAYATRRDIPAAAARSVLRDIASQPPNSAKSASEIALDEFRKQRIPLHGVPDIQPSATAGALQWALNRDAGTIAADLLHSMAGGLALASSARSIPASVHASSHYIGGDTVAERGPARSPPAPPTDIHVDADFRGLPAPPEHLVVAPTHLPHEQDRYIRHARGYDPADACGAGSTASYAAQQYATIAQRGRESKAAAAMVEARTAQLITSGQHTRAAQAQLDLPGLPTSSAGIAAARALIALWQAADPSVPSLQDRDALQLLQARVALRTAAPAGVTAAPEVDPRIFEPLRSAADAIFRYSMPRAMPAPGTLRNRLSVPSVVQVIRAWRALADRTPLPGPAQALIFAATSATQQELEVQLPLLRVLDLTRVLPDPGAGVQVVPNQLGVAGVLCTKQEVLALTPHVATAIQALVQRAQQVASAGTPATLLDASTLRSEDTRVATVQASINAVQAAAQLQVLENAQAHGLPSTGEDLQAALLRTKLPGIEVLLEQPGFLEQVRYAADVQALQRGAALAGPRTPLDELSIGSGPLGALLGAAAQAVPWSAALPAHAVHAMVHMATGYPAAAASASGLHDVVTPWQEAAQAHAPCSLVALAADTIEAQKAYLAVYTSSRHHAQASPSSRTLRVHGLPAAARGTCMRVDEQSVAMLEAQADSEGLKLPGAEEQEDGPAEGARAAWQSHVAACGAAGAGMWPLPGGGVIIDGVVAVPIARAPWHPEHDAMAETAATAAAAATGLDQQGSQPLATAATDEDGASFYDPDGAASYAGSDTGIPPAGEQAAAVPRDGHGHDAAARYNPYVYAERDTYAGMPGTSCLAAGAGHVSAWDLLSTAEVAGGPLYAAHATPVLSGAAVDGHWGCGAMVGTMATEVAEGEVWDIALPGEEGWDAQQAGAAGAVGDLPWWALSAADTVEVLPLAQEAEPGRSRSATPRKRSSTPASKSRASARSGSQADSSAQPAEPEQPSGVPYITVQAMEQAMPEVPTELPLFAERDLPPLPSGLGGAWGLALPLELAGADPIDVLSDDTESDVSDGSESEPEEHWTSAVESTGAGGGGASRKRQRARSPLSLLAAACSRAGLPLPADVHAEQLAGLHFAGALQGPDAGQAVHWGGSRWALEVHMAASAIKSASALYSAAGSTQRAPARTALAPLQAAIASSCRIGAAGFIAPRLASDALPANHALCLPPSSVDRVELAVNALAVARVAAAFDQAVAGATKDTASMLAAAAAACAMLCPTSAGGDTSADPGAPSVAMHWGRLAQTAASALRASLQDEPDAHTDVPATAVSAARARLAAAMAGGGLAAPAFGGVGSAIFQAPVLPLEQAEVQDVAARQQRATANWQLGGQFVA